MMGYGTPLLSSTRYQYLNAGMAAGAGGASLTSGSVAYGSLVTLGTAEFDFDALYLQCWGSAARFRLSLTANTGGGDEPLITDAFIDFSFEANFTTWSLFVPASLPRGAIIKGKVFSTSGSNVIGVVAQGVQGDARMTHGFKQLISATDFSGQDPTNFVTANGTTTTAWVVAQAVTTQRIAGLYAFVDARGATTPLGNQLFYQYDLGVGPSGSEKLLTSFVVFTGNTASNAFFYPPSGPFPCDVPAGSRMVYRVTANVPNTGVSSLVLCGLAA
jgi:hypothetical protein